MGLLQDIEDLITAEFNKPRKREYTFLTGLSGMHQFAHSRDVGALKRNPIVWSFMVSRLKADDRFIYCSLFSKNGTWNARHYYNRKMGWELYYNGVLVSKSTSASFLDNLLPREKISHVKYKAKRQYRKP